MRVAQPLAQWLVANPLNSVTGLALSLLLPIVQLLAGPVMILIALRLGLLRATTYGVIAAALVAGLSMLTGPVSSAWLIAALVNWMPALLLAALLGRTRSLVMTMQLSVVMAILATLAIPLLVGDPLAFWKTQIVELAAVFEQLELREQAESLRTQQDLLASQMTTRVVASVWSMSMVMLAVGYWLFQALPEQQGRFGRFCDLNLGRVLASLAAIGVGIGQLTGWGWLQSFGFVGLIVFWLQGLAIMHWLRVEGPLPPGLLAVSYVFLPFLVFPMAALGYSDAWLNLRARITQGRKK